MRRSRTKSVAQPTWPPGPSDRPRILVEADAAMQWAVQGILDAEGYDVAVCEGPHSQPDGKCPLAVGGTCALAEEADLIFNSLGVRPTEHRAVLTALRARLPDTPILVEVPASHAKDSQELVGCRVAFVPLTSTELRRHVREALQDSTPARTSRAL